MTAEELLATMAEPLPEDDGYCIIDPETRVITIPPEYQLLGVESDEKAERIYFKCPKIVGDDIDLSKLALRVNFRNAGQVVDQYLVDDVAVDGDNITFSWLLSRRVTQYEGDVNFIVCAVRVSGETITNEWNTTLATAQVLEGLEAEIVLPEEETDIVNQLLSLAETRLNDVKKATADANTAASNANQKAQEAENAAEDARGVIEQITKDSYLHTALQSFIDTVTASPTAYGNAIVKKIEGFIKQEKTTGTQLFDAFHVDVANGARNAKALNGGKDVQVTGKKSDSGTGYAYYTIPASLVDGKSIYVYSEYSGNASFSMSIKKSDNTWQNSGIQTRTWTKIDIPQGALQASVILYPNGITATDETAIFKNIKVGFAQFETWEPYTGGQPAPSPDYPMVVQGNGNYGFWDGKFENGAYKITTGKPESGTNCIRCLNDITYPLKSGDKIKFIYEKPVNIGICLFDKQGVLTYSSSSLSSEWEYTTTKDQEKFRFYILDRDGVNAETAKHLTITINGMYAICIRSHSPNLLDIRGKTDDYHPYQSNVTYIPVDYPLFEGDKIIQRNGEYKLLRRRGFRIYDGSDDEDWKINYVAGSVEQNSVFNVYIGDMANDAKKDQYVPCNYFGNKAMGYNINSTYVSLSGNYNIILSPDMKIDTVQKWKDWLKAHALFFVYELETPTEETLSPEAVKALNSIMATDEQTELTIVGVPADAEIQNQFLLPRNEDGALNTTAYCTAEKNKIVLNELVAQNLDARVNKLEIDNAALAEQTIIVE